jgi:hypothetical protein
MAYLENMRKTCTDRATNPEWPLQLLKSITQEFEQGLNGGIFDASYVLSKIEPLARHVRWLEGQAEREWAARWAAEDAAAGDCDCSGCDGCGTHCAEGCASGDGEPCRA